MDALSHRRLTELCVGRVRQDGFMSRLSQQRAPENAKTQKKVVKLVAANMLNNKSS